MSDNSNADPDYNAEDGLALKISQGAGGNPIGRFGYASDINGGASGGGNNNSINTRLGTTMVARIKVVRDTDMVANMWIRDNHNGTGGSGNDREPFGAGCRVEWDASNQVSESVNSAGPFIAGYLNKPDAYHIVRINDGWGPYGEHVVKVWVDESEFPNPALEVHGAQAENETAYNAFCIGTFGSTSDSEVYYDWVTWTNAGMYGPGEEESCLGTSLSLPPGACCDHGVCKEVQPEECRALNGHFQGRQTHCSAPTCCGPPFADADFDRDVDQQDFSVLQLCVGLPAPLSQECKCFDRPQPEFPNGNDVIDTIDLAAFEACASGPGILADTNCENAD